MFLQEKEYIQLFRGNEKLMTAGLCKTIIWDQKIKVDYYMDHLPISNETNGICHLFYLVRNEEEGQSLIQRQFDFPLVFLKSKFHYAFQTHENAGNKIVKIENCYIELEGQYTLQMHGKHPEIKSNVQPAIDSDASTEVKTDVQSAVSEPVSEVQASVKVDAGSGTRLSESPHEKQSGIKTDTKSDSRKRAYMQKAKDVKDILAVENTEQMSDNIQSRNDAQSLSSEKESTQSSYPVRRLDDLKELLTMGDDFVEYYYNSFLLHGFYQYRHLLLGKDFLGVPGYFYEREAIAAKMMGFPYFIEAEHADFCCMGKGNRADRPVEGSYGYFICSTGGVDL